MIRILIADDSAFMRKVLSDLFAGQPDFEVVGAAYNGKDTIEKVVKLKPDLLTLDINMPVMDGLTALEIIMKDCALPVVMISSMTKAGADATVKALELGAVDFINKVSGPISSITAIENEILEKCRAAASANWRTNRRIPTVSPPAPVPPQQVRPLLREPVFKKKIWEDFSSMGHKTEESYSGSIAAGMGKLVAIGTSTGGPRALQQVITQLPGDLPCGVVIVQHMPPGFTKSLAERLDSLSAVTVKEAEANDIVKPGHVYIAPGDYHMRVQKQGNSYMIALNQDPPLASHRPAVDILFDSVVPFGSKVVSVILTGMGSDGAKGMQKIKAAGGKVIAEDESTSVIYGMPKAVAELGIADSILPIQCIADAIVNSVKKSS